MRRKIVKGSFSAVDKDIKDAKEVLLVDDIITTSATAAECAGIIKQNYNVSVSVAAIAATPLR